MKHGQLEFETLETRTLLAADIFLGDPVLVPGGGRTGSQAAFSADLNGDNLPDLVAADFSEDRLVVSRGLANGELDRPQIIELNEGTIPLHLEFADLNNDSLQDIIVAGRDRTVILLNEASSTSK